MACTAIVQGYEHDCLDSVGGITELYVTEFDNITQSNITSSSGTISAMTADSGQKFYTLEVRKQTAQVTQAVVSSPENGTQYVEQTVTFNLHKMTAAARYTVESLAKNRLMIIAKDNNGLIYLLGQTTGLDAGDATGDSGKAFGDLNGYTLTFKGMEPELASYMAQGILDTLRVSA